jgi:acyl dehydratase
VVDQARIDAFAEVTGDRYWLHTDPQRARSEGPFDGTIAHGFLLLSLTVGDDVTEVTGLPGVARVLNYGLDKVRFLTPVGSGSRVRIHSRVESLVEKSPGRWLLRQIKTVEVQGQVGPALVAEQLTLISMQ